MKILVACEESQAVCKAFRSRGHEAYSCDIQECSGGHPEWHIKGDVLKVINPWFAESDLSYGVHFTTMDGKGHFIHGKWDMIIAFPPCTHLAVSGAGWFEAKRADGRQRSSIDFFSQFLNANCDRIAIENPIGIISGDYIPKHFPDLAEKYGFPLKPTQIVHPWMFGDNYSKSTCLWLKGLEPLAPIVTKQPPLEWFKWVDGKTGKKKRQPKWFADAWHLPAEKRSRVRSKTFPGIARAMADQWG